MSIEQGHHFDPGWLGIRSRHLQVRIVAGDDGRDKIQMRMDLGLIQMELAGRPDGLSPAGFESLLELYEARARAAEAAGEDFSLDSGVCAALMREGVQYYHRYLAAFHLQRYDLVARDTERNLRLFAFVVQHAARQRDKVQFDQYRPYVTMMRARALGLAGPGAGRPCRRPGADRRGIEGIRAFLRDYDQAEHEAECVELGFLLRWRREVERDRPIGPLERLEQQLTLAVATGGLRGGGPDPRPAPPAPGGRGDLVLGPLLTGCRLPAPRHSRGTGLILRRVAATLILVRLRPDTPLPCSTRGDPFGEPMKTRWEPIHDLLACP